MDLEEKQTADKRKVDSTPVLKVDDIWNACKKYWYWFLISIVVCMGLGLLSYLRSVPTYSRSNMILVIKSIDGASNDAGAMLHQFGLGEINPHKLNEMISLTTPTVMMEVTRQLNLNVNYSKPGNWHSEDLYGPTLPFLVDFPGWDESKTGSLKVQVLPKHKLKVTEVSSGGQIADNLNITVDYTRPDTIKTPVGEFAFKANPVYVGAPIKSPMDVNVTRNGVYPTAMSLVGRVKSEIVQTKSDIIRLSLVDAVPARAEDILNRIIHVYDNTWTTERAHIADATSKFIDERLALIEQELGSVEGEIAGFKSAHLMMDAESAASNYMSQASRASDQVNNLSNQLAMTRYIRDFLAAASTSNSVLPSNTGLGSSAIESQIAEYNRTLFERNALASNSSTSNPVVAELDSRLDALRRALMQSLDNQIAALNTQLASAQRVESVSTGKMAASPGQARYLLSAERKQKVKESLYLFLLQKREESELSNKIVASKIRVISTPTGSNGPLGPYRDTILMISFVIGLLLPLAIIILREMLNTRVRHRKDIEVLKVPFAGELPQVNGSKLDGVKKLFHVSQKPLGLLVQPDNLDFINEAFRVLRTNIELMARHDEHAPAATIAVTSLYPGSGKTFISMNLAAALAIKGRKVLLLDMDLRRYSLTSQLLPHRHDHGLVDYLVKVPGITPDNIVEHDIHGVKGLDFIPTGIIPPNPSELLTDPLLANLLEQMKQRYDYIIFDCPPVEIVADALIVNTFVDMTLFVVRAGLFRRSQLPLVQEMYDTQRYHSLAVVLNSAPENTDGYGYGYRYGSYRRRYKKKK